MGGLETTGVDTPDEQLEQRMTAAERLLEAKLAKARERAQAVLELFAESGAVAATYDRGEGLLGLDDDLELPVNDHANAQDARRLVAIRRRELEN